MFKLTHETFDSIRLTAILTKELAKVLNRYDFTVQLSAKRPLWGHEIYINFPEGNFGTGCNYVKLEWPEHWDLTLHDDGIIEISRNFAHGCQRDQIESLSRYILNKSQVSKKENRAMKEFDFNFDIDALYRKILARLEQDLNTKNINLTLSYIRTNKDNLKKYREITLAIDNMEPLPIFWYEDQNLSIKDGVLDTGTDSMDLNSYRKKKSETLKLPIPSIRETYSPPLGDKDLLVNYNPYTIVQVATSGMHLNDSAKTYKEALEKAEYLTRTRGGKWVIYKADTEMSIRPSPVITRKLDIKE